MILLQPEERAAQEEAPDLVPPIVEDQRAPVLVLALARVLVLVERRPVEAGQAVRVLGEVPRHPVEQHADPRPVARVDERPEVVRFAEAAGRREEADDLVAPRPGERVLHDRQQFDVREPQVVDVRHEPLGQLPVRQEPLAVRAARPRTEVHLVGGHRPIEPAVLMPAFFHPLVVAPAETRRPGHDGGGARRQLEAHRVGVGFREHLAVLRPQLELVLLAGANPRDEDLPHAVRQQQAHRVDAPVPAVEVADDADAVGVGRPDREVDPGDRAAVRRVRAEFLVSAQLRALAQQVEIEVGQDPAEPVGIVHLAGAAVLPADAQAVVHGQRVPRPPRHHPLEQVGPCEASHRERPARHRREQLDVLGVRVEIPNHQRGLAGHRFLVRTEEGEGIAVVPALECRNGIEWAHRLIS